MLSYAFVDTKSYTKLTLIGEDVYGYGSTDPYESIQVNFEHDDPTISISYKFCIIKNNKVIIELPKMILVKWAIACSENVLPIFEKEIPNENRPRNALEMAKKLMKEHDLDIDEENIIFDSLLTLNKIQAIRDITSYPLASLSESIFSMYSSSRLTIFPRRAAYYAEIAGSQSNMPQILWQRIKLRSIIDRYLVKDLIYLKLPKDLLQKIWLFI